MPDALVVPPLLGRSAAIDRLEDVVRLARDGLGTTTVLRGPAGIGKTALLEATFRAAAGMQLLRYRGTESERSMPYAGLQLFLSGAMTTPPSLSGPLHVTLETVFGRSHGQVDPALAGLAAAAVIGEAVQGRPTLVVLDDAHWLDDETAAALVFAFRRLANHPLGVVIATRSPGADPFADLPALQLPGLSTSDATALLNGHAGGWTGADRPGRAAAAVLGRMDDAVRRRIVAEAGGNPGRLIAAVAGTADAEFAGGFGYAPVLRGGRSVWLDEAGPEERRLLVLAAADPTGDPALLWRAVDGLGIDRRVVTRLEDRGRLQVGSHVLFADPSERAAVYHFSDASERKTAHQALAGATAAPDRRAWHLAQAATGPDDVLAAQLEKLVAQAGRRAGQSAAAAFLEQSALLTSDSRLRAARALGAADAHFTAGSTSSTAQMLVTAVLAQPDRRGRAEFAHQQARLTALTHRSADTATELLSTAHGVHATGAPFAADALLEALVAAANTSRLGPGTEVVANKLPPGQTGAGLASVLLNGLTLRFTQGFPASYPSLAHATTHATEHATGRGTQHAAERWFWLAARVAGDLWQDERWEALAVAALDSARESGSLLLLPAALTEVSLVLLHRGELDAVGRLLTQLDATTSSMQAPRLFEAALLHDGWSGADELISTARRSALQRGDGAVLATAALSEAVLNNGLGHYNAALTAAHDAMRFDELLTYGRAATELIEAASRTGEHAAGHQALAALTERTQLATTDWALGIEARSRALLSGDAAPEPFYREAVERLSRTRMTADLARARLVYGEWLRRQGRRVDARAELALARETLVSIGATAFADRADREYRAAGETIRQGPLQGRRLTPQESRVTAMARQGLTNPQIGERLYLSPRTVEYHLHKVYEKLGISSRRELVHAFPGQDAGSDVLPDDSQQPASRQ